MELTSQNGFGRIGRVETIFGFLVPNIGYLVPDLVSGTLFGIWYLIRFWGCGTGVLVPCDRILTRVQGGAIFMEVDISLKSIPCGG